MQVGDAEHSYAFDGKRVKLWNQGATSYGEAWVPGDVIGCGIDLVHGTVSFWRNGKALGVASDNVATGPGRAYYPAFSLALRERCRLNFGGSPLSFPVEGYSPLQAPNPAHMRVSAYLASAIVSSFVHFHKPPPPPEGQGGDSSSSEGEGCGLDLAADDADVEVAAALAGALKPELLRLRSSLSRHGSASSSGRQCRSASSASASSSSTPGSDSDSSVSDDTADKHGGCAAADAVDGGANSTRSGADDGLQAENEHDSVFRHELGFFHNPTGTAPAAACGKAGAGEAEPAASTVECETATAKAKAKTSPACAAPAASFSFSSSSSSSIAGNEAMLKLICCSHAFGALLPILTPYVVTANFMAAILGPIYSRVSPCAIKSLINTMKAVLPVESFHKIVRMTLMDIGYFIERNTPWTGCEKAIKIARIFLTHREAVAAMACFPEGVVHKIFSGLFSTKLMAAKDAETVFPKTWWRTAPKGGGFCDVTVRERCQFFSQAILYAMEELHAITRWMLQDNLPFPPDWVADTHRFNADGSISPAPIADSPRGLFEWWMAKLVKLNLGLIRQVIPVGTSDHTVLCNVQGALSRVFVDMIAESPDKLNGIETILAHVDNVVTPHSLPRLGGLHSFLKAEHHKGVAKGTIAPPAKAPECTLAFQLLDWSVVLFSLSMVNPLRQLTNAHVEVERAMEQEQAAQARLKAAAAADRAHHAEPAMLAVLKQGVEVSCERVMSFVRSVTLFEVAYMDKVKAAVFEKWTGVLAGLMLKAQKDAHFDFIPEAYITVVLHAFTVVHTESSIFAPAHPLPYFLRTESSKAWLLNYARLVVVLISDTRIKSPDLNVTVIAKVKSLLGVPEYLRCIEQDPAICRGMLEVLMLCFNDRFWVPSTDILVRFWAGAGFGGHRTFGRVLKQPLQLLQSEAMRDTFEAMCSDSPTTLSTYLNHLINHLNWTVSEFDQMLEEIRRIGDRADRGGDQVFRRCTVTHTLGINLLRLLEGFATAGQAMLFKPDDPTNLVRMVQLLLHLLNRLTGNDQLIDTVLAMGLMPMQHVSKQAFVDPILGTLFTLVGELPAVEPASALTKAAIEANPALKAVLQDGACKSKLLASLKVVADTLDVRVRAHCASE